MHVITIDRKHQSEKQTLGIFTVENTDGLPLFASLLLERGWKNNEQNISCIPTGTYTIKKEYSNAFKTDLWEVKGVENRSEIKIHQLNYYYQSKGCMGPGMSLKDLNNDGEFDVTSSVLALNAFHKAMGNETEAILIVKNPTCRIHYKK